MDHELSDILTAALCAILCGGDRFYDMEDFGEVRLDGLKSFLRPRTTPATASFKPSTRRRLGDALARWTQGARAVLGGEVVALDGKTLRRALNRTIDRLIAEPAF